MPQPKSSARIGLALHPRRDPTEVAEKIARWARSHRSDCSSTPRTPHDVPTACVPVTEDELAQQADALISLGGDGTMLGAMRLAATRAVPVIGVTWGGSAAGGPVVSPELDAVIVSPVAPVSGIARPAVISVAEPTRLTLLEGSGRPALQADGTVLRRMQPGEMLDVHLRPRAGRVVRLDAERYARRSQVKLSLLDLPFLPDAMRDLVTDADRTRLTGETHSDMMYDVW